MLVTIERPNRALGMLLSFHLRSVAPITLVLSAGIAEEDDDDDDDHDNDEND